ncbi:hypothetical protein Misp02_50910 [Microtetraspora sp. NBRC 16547]|nr:hypothetical protein Misp02_50910 [Microtetraspora sp. NBRC 16547]
MTDLDDVSVPPPRRVREPPGGLLGLGLGLGFPPPHPQGEAVAREDLTDRLVGRHARPSPGFSTGGLQTFVPVLLDLRTEDHPHLAPLK